MFPYFLYFYYTVGEKFYPLIFAGIVIQLILCLLFNRVIVHCLQL